ncbi:MAG TPA: manganese-dependent inorganic pyrophosphatase [Desulfurivibrio alkaliphilus]|uniref:inorganic diphosphatase n=1 Tax=Desulfurivibrio alkaliphilus TaxID=427923 RepID=A0A7C2XFY8_9BACT|nr:manganese-dependent inorganic pyrophosphatase [Desulfurivibrio alkaliphilus]
MSVYVVGHSSPDTDSVASAIAFAHYLKATGTDAVPVVQSATLNPESKLVLDKFGLPQPAEFTDAGGKDVALVDFSDIAQAPANIKDANVVAIVDHHKIGDITTGGPILFYAKPVGCTCTVLHEMYKNNNVELPKNIAGAMLCAILSDTVNFKSPTCTDEDKAAVKALAGIAGVSDTDGLFMEMLKAKSAVDGVPIKDLIFRDYKDFDMGGKKVGICQLELATLDQVAPMRADLVKGLEAVKAEGRHSIIMMLTDVVKEGSELLVLSDEPGIIEKAFNGKLSNNTMWVDGMMSRKKQTVPPLQKAFGA